MECASLCSLDFNIISILLICRYHGMWFGQKENGITGFFEHEKAIKTDDDDQGRCLFILLFILIIYLFFVEFAS